MTARVQLPLMFTRCGILDLSPSALRFAQKITSEYGIVSMGLKLAHFLYNDTTCDYRDLLDKTGYDSLHLRCIKTIACEVFKSLFKLSPEFINELFKPKEVNYDLRNNSLLMQPNFKKIRYGKNTFQYYGAHFRTYSQMMLSNVWI